MHDNSDEWIDEGWMDGWMDNPDGYWNKGGAENVCQY